MTLREQLRGMIPLMVVLLFGVLMLVDAKVSAGQSDNYELTICHFEPNDIDPITYRYFHVLPNFETAFRDGKNRWNASPVPGYLQEHSFHWDPEINVTDDFEDSIVRGSMLGECYAHTAIWRGHEVEIHFNTKWSADHSSFYWDLVA